MNFHLVDNQVLSTHGQPDVFNLHSLTEVRSAEINAAGGVDLNVDAAGGGGVFRLCPGRFKCEPGGRGGGGGSGGSVVVGVEKRV